MSNKIAVLLAAYNGKSWLDEQLESILMQSGVVLHIYISVDLSDDGTYQWCLAQQQKYENVTVLNYGQHFGGAAKNFFRLIRDVDFSRYDYISLADQDDIWLPTKLVHAVSKMQQHGLDGFSSDVIAFWSNGKEKLVKKSYPQKLFDHYFEAAGPGCTYVLTQSSFYEFKTFLTINWNEVNEVSLHDWMIYSFYRANNLKWHIDSVPLMRYRQHERNQVGYNSGFKAALLRIRKVKNNWYSTQVNLISQLLGIREKINLRRLFLIINFRQLRRRPRDAYALLITLITGIY